jgi:hypothetical protein
MSLFHLRRLVLVAAVTGIRFEVLWGGVAGGAGIFLAPPAVAKGKRVLEDRADPGGGGMALGTGCTVGPFVNFRFGMAGKTILRSALKDIGLVTGFAIDLPMPAGQLERRQIMVEPVQPGQNRMAALVLGMTGSAFQAFAQLAVQGLPGVELSANIGMAVQATVGHSLAAPGRCVAGGAVSLCCRVGCDAAMGNILSALAAQGARAEHFPAVGKDNGNDCRQRHQGGDWSRCHTTKGFHDGLVSLAQRQNTMPPPCG